MRHANGVFGAHSRRGQWFVLPDNGVLTLVDDEDSIDAAYEIQNAKWMIGNALSSTFHGRDIFSPVGAHLARGDNPSEAGPALDVKSLVRLPVRKATVDMRGISATVIGTDGPFGNLVTNVTREDFAQLGYSLGQTIRFKLAGKPLQIPFVKTFSDVPLGQPLFYIDSRGRLSLAVNQGNFIAVAARGHGISQGRLDALVGSEDENCAHRSVERERAAFR